MSSDIKYYLIVGIVLCVFPIHASVFYISPDGDDANDGSISYPLYSVYRAQELVTAGDTVYIRGGNYLLEENDISYVHNNLFACYAYIDKSGTEGNRINYWAYPGEQPVFDFTAIRPANKRVVGFYITADYIHFKGLEITGVQVTITTHTESYCFYNYGSHNIFELLDLHDNQGTGLRHRQGGYNLFLNCDAYRNHDYTSEDGRGGNTDGFGCHPSNGGKGNVFRGCRAWFNSDDGYDILGAAESVFIENCWAMYNGYSPAFVRLGDGNGFKAGGYGSTPVDRLPTPIPRHTVQYCLAVKNKASGFYANHHIGGITWYNNSAYMNSTNYNMLNRLEDNETDVPGYNHRMRNNLGYKGGAELRNINKDLCNLSHNYFDLEIEITDKDFKSLLMSELIGPRQEDGSLPDTKFMHLASGSDLVDKGKDLGFAFEGYLPDLGAFEQGYAKFPTQETYWFQRFSPEYYWEEGNTPYYRIFGLLWVDTIINDIPYQRLYEFPDERLIPELAVYSGAIREDSMRRVFYRGDQIFPYQVADSGDILLYDFHVTIGDTIRSDVFPAREGLIVSKVDSVSIGGKPRPRIHFKNDPYTKWIEGVGNEQGILFYAEEILNHGVWNELVCFWHDGEIHYHNEAYENCWEEMEPEPEPEPVDTVGNSLSNSFRDGYTIFPNPSKNRIHIKFASSFSGKIMIYDVHGKLCLETNSRGITYTSVPIESLGPGIYLVRMVTRNNCYRKLILVR